MTGGADAPGPIPLRDEMRQAIGLLRGAGIPDAQRDVRWMAASVLGLDPARLLAHTDRMIAGAELGVLRDHVRRRCAREPLSHILRGRWFYGHWFEVTPDVLDPRPETETLVEAALALPFREVLDLGTGSGCILLSLLAARGEAAGLGVDLSDEALAVASRNALALGVDARLHLEQSDWFSAVDRQFDLIVSNPPYIRADEMAGLAPELHHEPRLALTDEGDGLGAYRRIIAAAPAHLVQGGWLLVEIGLGQGPEVQAMMGIAGFEDIGARADLDGRDRVILGRLPER